MIEPEGVDFGPISFTVQAFVAITAPLLGVAFGFDAVNGERHQGTLPRLLSQPIHRDDVINGKFAAGLIAISLALGALILVRRRASACSGSGSRRRWRRSSG